MFLDKWINMLTGLICACVFACACVRCCVFACMSVHLQQFQVQWWAMLGMATSISFSLLMKKIPRNWMLSKISRTKCVCEYCWCMYGCSHFCSTVLHLLAVPILGHVGDGNIHSVFLIGSTSDEEFRRIKRCINTINKWVFCCTENLLMIQVMQ